MTDRADKLDENTVETDKIDAANGTEKSEGRRDTESEKKVKAKKPKKKKKPKFVDDGRTVYSMEGLNKHKTDSDSLDLSKKEKRALIKAAFAHYLPIFLGVIGCFSIAAILMYLWLH